MFDQINLLAKFTFTYFDGITLAIVLLFSIIGLLRGFVRRILTLIALVLGILIPMFFGGQLAKAMFKGDTSNSHILVTSIALGLTIFLILFFIFAIITKTLSKMAFNGVDRFFGFLLGFVKGTLIVLAILTICHFVLDRGIIKDSNLYKFLDANLRSTDKTSISQFLYEKNFFWGIVKFIKDKWPAINTDKVALYFSLV